MNARSAPLVSEAFVTLLQGGMSICVASSGADGLPGVGRALGCRFSPDRRRMTVFLSRPQVPRFLEDVATNGHIAVVLSEPASHRSWQFKGTDARVGPLAKGDPARIRAYVETFVRDVAPLGYPPHLLRGLLAGPREEPVPEACVAVTFTPTSAFSQTPGIAAGDPLEPPA